MLCVATQSCGRHHFLNDGLELADLHQKHERVFSVSRRPCVVG